MQVVYNFDPNKALYSTDKAIKGGYGALEGYFHGLEITVTVTETIAPTACQC